MKPGDVQGSSLFLEEAELLLEQGRFDSARRLAEENLARIPSDIEGRIILCRALLGMDSLDAAEQWIHEIDRWIRFTARIYLEAGDSFARKGRLDEAARFYRKFLHLDPDASEAEEIAAKIRDADNLNQVAENDSDGHHVHIEEIDRQFWTVTLADLYARQGHPEMSRMVLEDILKRDPHHKEARMRLEALPKEDAGGGAGSGRRLAEELARWLKNIDRLKSHGT